MTAHRHALEACGAAHDDNGQPATGARWLGRARCRCGWLGEVRTKDADRKADYRLHKTVTEGVRS